jgi:ribosomal protein S6
MGLFGVKYCLSMAKTETKTEKVDVAAAAGRLYLLTFLVRDEKSLTTVKDHLKDRVTIVKEESLGPKTLAFPINKHPELTLMSIFFTADHNVIAGIEKELKLEDEVERFLLTDWQGDINKEDRAERRRVKKEDA